MRHLHSGSTTFCGVCGVIIWICQVYRRLNQLSACAPVVLALCSVCGGGGGACIRVSVGVGVRARHCMPAWVILALHFLFDKRLLACAPSLPCLCRCLDKTVVNLEDDEAMTMAVIQLTHLTLDGCNIQVLDNLGLPSPVLLQ